MLWKNVPIFRIDATPLKLSYSPKNLFFCEIVNWFFVEKRNLIQHQKFDILTNNFNKLIFPGNIWYWQCCFITRCARKNFNLLRKNRWFWTSYNVQKFRKTILWNNTGATFIRYDRLEKLEVDFLVHATKKTNAFSSTPYFLRGDQTNFCLRWMIINLYNVDSLML